MERDDFFWSGINSGFCTLGLSPERPKKSFPVMLQITEATGVRRLAQFVIASVLLEKRARKGPEFECHRQSACG